jgi:hypothetical protein
MPDIWTACAGQDQIQALETMAFRIIESQEKVATMTLVDYRVSGKSGDHDTG